MNFVLTFIYFIGFVVCFYPVYTKICVYEKPDDDDTVGKALLGCMATLVCFVWPVVITLGGMFYLSYKLWNHNTPEEEELG